MAYNIDSVKSYGANAPDQVIQDNIDAFTATTYPCLTSSYDQATADVIANSYTAGHLIVDFDSGSGQVTSRRSPNGASRSFKKNKYGDSGEYTHPLIETAYRLDTENCLPINSSEFYIGTSGTTYAPDNPVYKDTTNEQ